MKPSDRVIAAALCRTLAVLGEGSFPFLPERERRIISAAVQRVCGRQMLSPDSDVSPDEAIVALCLTAAVLEAT